MPTPTITATTSTHGAAGHPRFYTAAASIVSVLREPSIGLAEIRIVPINTVDHVFLRPSRPLSRGTFLRRRARRTLAGRSAQHAQRDARPAFRLDADCRRCSGRIPKPGAMPCLRSPISISIRRRIGSSSAMPMRRKASRSSRCTGFARSFMANLAMSTALPADAQGVRFTSSATPSGSSTATTRVARCTTRTRSSRPTIRCRISARFATAACTARATSA